MNMLSLREYKKSTKKKHSTLTDILLLLQKK